MSAKRLSGLVHYCNCGDHAWQVLTKGYVTLVDPDDAHFLTERPWYTNTSGASVHRQSVYAYSSRPLHMLHVLIAGNRQDHKNRNGLDNRKRNLRPATASQNGANRLRLIPNRSGFRGVYLRSGKYVAEIRFNQKLVYIGRFTHAEDAALAYDSAARARFGEFATLNFPDLATSSCGLPQAPAA